MSVTGNRTGRSGVYHDNMVVETAADEVGTAAARSGRREELALLFHDHYASLVRLALLLTSDPSLAEDLAQEAFVRTWRAWNRIRKEGSAPAYLRATVVNLARSSLRRRLVGHRHEAAEAASPAASGRVARGGDPADRVAVTEALRRLPHGQRSVIVLRYHLDYSEQQTAEALGIAPGTVKSQTHKALARLGELLSDD
jgi:RNA polymerase sigma-70 factor (sigma-E family)